MVDHEDKVSKEKEQNFDNRSSAQIRYSRAGYFILAWVLVICIIVQVFIAGMAIFENPINWGMHTTFVHIFEFIPIVMFILGFVGRLPRLMTWGSLGLYLLIFIQYATANGVSPALHPVIALALFWGSLALARRSFQVVSGRLKN